MLWKSGEPNDGLFWLLYSFSISAKSGPIMAFFPIKKFEIKNTKLTIEGVSRKVRLG